VAEPKQSERKEKVMFTMYANSTRMAISAIAAVAIVSFNAVALDQGHIASARKGTVEVGELTLVETAPLAAVSLPEVTVIAKREVPAEASFAATTQLPEVFVIAKRVAYLVVRSEARDQARSASAKGSAEGALLK
jgi:hypothetical protein